MSNNSNDADARRAQAEQEKRDAEFAKAAARILNERLDNMRGKQ